MKKILIGLFIFILAGAVFADTSESNFIHGKKKQLTHQVPNCLDFTQYFQFINGEKFNQNNFGFYLESENFNVDSTLHSDEKISGGISPIVYTNTFTAADESIRAGEVHIAHKYPIIPIQVAQAECELVFSCRCTASNGCYTAVVTNGERCSIGGGDGSQSAPYYIELGGENPN